MRAPSCRFVHSAIYLTAGYLQGDATNECYHAIRRQELYGTLYKYYDGRWVPMVTRQQIRDNGRNSLDNARKTAVHPRHQCLQVPYRSWNFTASAWVLYQDVWYGDGGQSNQAFHCGWK